MTISDAERERRLAEALRQNLRRRKAQAREKGGQLESSDDPKPLPSAPVAVGVVSPHDGRKA